MEKINTVISGSASGIGKAAKNLLLKEGHNGIGIDIKDADIIADLSDLNATELAIKKAKEICNNKIDHLVTAAGLGGHHPNKLKILQVNYLGTIRLLHGLIDCLANSNNAAVVVIGSNSATFSDFAANPVVDEIINGNIEKAASMIPEGMDPLAYPLSKYAVMRFMRRLSLSWGKLGVRINALVPGQTNTPLYKGVLEHPRLKDTVDKIILPINRIIEPEEMATFISLLLSPGMKAMHGRVLWADCGADAASRPEKF